MKEFIRQEAPNIAAYLPKFLCHDREMAEGLSVESLEHDRQRALLIEMFRQLFVHSATWGLDRWEGVLGLEHNGGASDETRRNNILLKLQSRQISTVAFMRRLAAAYFADGTNIHVKECNRKNTFQIASDTISTNYVGLIDAIETYKPAHLAFSFGYEIDGATNVYFGGVVGEYEIIDIESGGNIDFTLSDTQIYFGGYVDGYEIIEIRGV